MADRLSAYADWLVANQNKQGTPEFETVANSYKQLRSQGTTAPVDRSFSSALASGLDAPLENIGVTAEMVGAKGLGGALRNATDAPVNYESASERVGNPQEGDFTVPTPFGDIAPGYLPRAAVEQIGQYAGSLATRAAGAGAGGLVAGPGGAIAGGLAGPALFEFVQQLGPIAARRAKNNGRSEPSWEDWKASAAASGLSGALNALGVKGGTGAKFLTKTLREGATEGTQSVIEQTGSTAGTDVGLQIDPKQAMVEGIIGGTTAGGVDVVTSGTKAAVNAISPNDTPTDQEAAADLADRLQGIIAANNLNVKDIKKKSTKGAREAVDKAHIQIAEEMKQLRDDLKKILKVDRLDDIDTVVDKVSAEAGARQARNKTKSTVGQQEFDATERLVGNTAEGQQLLKLYRQSNELTELHNQGYIGGLSQFTDQVSPFSSQVGYAPGSAAELPTRLLGTAAGLSLNPAYTAAQVGAVGAGRAVDALTGRRSTVRKYLQQNAGNQGVSIDPDAPSIRAAVIQDDETRKALEAKLRAERLLFDDPPKGLDLEDQNPSPEAVMMRVTGIRDRNEIDAILDNLSQERPNLKSAIKSYRKMLREGTQVDNLDFLVSAVRGYADRNPTVAPNRTAPTTPSVFTGETPGYRRGIEANRQKIENIKRDVNADPNLIQDDKEIIFDALDDMGGNLGLDPRRTATGILDAAVEVSTDKIAVADYLNDYVQRVDRQQKQSAAKAKAEERPKPRISGLPEQDDIEGFVDLRLPEEAPPKRKHRKIGEELMSEQNQRFGRDLDPYNDGGDFETVAAEMTKEAQFQSDKTPDAAHWYDNDIREAIATTAEVLPEINETPDHRQLFLLLAALTSVGQKPKLNWRYAGSLAMHYYRTGELGEIGQIYSDKRQRIEERLVNPVTGKLLGQKAGSIEPGLYILRHMLNTRGLNETISWLNSAKTKAEIDAMRKEAGYGPQGKIKGGKNAVVPAIQMFGPKVGPFYMNLNGIHEVTVDLWASRTVRRHTGGLLLDPKTKGFEKTSGLVDSPTELERPTMKDLFTRVGENLGVTPQSAQAILWAYEQELYNDLGANLIYEKFSEGAEAFRETEAVAYADRDARIASGQAGSGTNDASASIEQNQQLKLDFGQRSDGELQPKTVAAGSRPASPEEVREAKPTVDALFEIGKPGSPFENGIPDIETAQKLANALNLSLTVAKNKAELARVFGRKTMPGGKNTFNLGGAQMNADPRETYTVPSGLGGVRKIRAKIGILGEYNNPNDPRESVTPLEGLFAALHEIGHGIEASFVPGMSKEEQAKTKKLTSGYKRLSDGRLTKTNRVYENTFRYGVSQLMDAAKGDNLDPTEGVPDIDQQLAQDILDEIVRMQRTGKLTKPGSNNPIAVRGTYPTFEDAILEAEQKGDDFRARRLELQLMEAEDTYFQTPQELAADLFGLYLMNPQQAKREMPKATKLVRDLMNKGDTLTFFSMPFAAVVAAIFANMLLAEGEEEDRKGILAQQTI